MTMALDNLGNQVSYATDFDNGGEDVAYALYDLARAGRAAIGDLRYYLEARLDAFGSPLAKAQLGAALALYGDRTRAATAFAAAVEGLDARDERYRYRTDYGSQLRDTAGVLALAAEFTPGGRRSSGTGHAARRAARPPTLDLDAGGCLDAARRGGTRQGSGRWLGHASTATPLTGTVYRRYDQEHFDAAAVSIANTGNTADRDEGLGHRHPRHAAAGQQRRLHHLARLLSCPMARRSISSQRRAERPFRGGPDGEPDNARLGPVRGGRSAAGRVRDRKPGPVGEASACRRSAAGSRLDHASACRVAHRPVCRGVPLWLRASTASRTAYMVRAVSPGTFVLPGATVEDMYRPELRANTAAGSIEISAPGP